MIAAVCLLLPAVVLAQTECQKCCAPGGDCSKAYKNGPGACCGEVAGNSFCCPTRSNEMGAARCWACNNAFRCYSGIRPMANICATEGGTKGINRGGGMRGEGGDGVMGLVVVFVSFVAIVMAVSACVRHRRQMPLTMTPQGTAGMQMASVGTPMGKPGQPMAAVQPGMPMGTAMPVGGCYPAGYGGYPHQTGYGGGTVAASAGMGFLGGMMVGEMMSDHGHGGGDYGGGGDMGGDFAADM